LASSKTSDDVRQGVTYSSLRRHCLQLEEAIDLRIANRIRQARDNGKLLGCAISSDESPPGETRFCGMRFQITMCHAVFVLPMDEWEHAKFDQKYPINVEHHLCDLNHVPDKTGAATFSVICSQVGRIGVFSGDVVAGASDGGGENMGAEGVHNQFTDQCESYVRRRCFSHVSWRVADAGIAEMLEDSWHLPAYLRDGISWSRICAIATQPVANGGLQLFREFSIADRDFKSPTPPAVLDGRPETNFLFLKWLLPRQELLAQIVPRDVEQRSLKGKAAQASAKTMASPFDNLCRWIDLVMLAKGLYLFHENKSLHYIVRKYTYDSIVEKATHIIMGLDVASHVLEVLNIEESDLDPEEKTQGWLELILKRRAGAQAEDFREEVLSYHGKIALRMSGHLRLTWENMNTSMWVSGGILSMDADTARTSARLFHRLLIQKRIDELRPYEKACLNNESMMKNLDEFANQDPPSLVWRMHGKFAILFCFLAPRFLGCGDTVLDVESVHARWKWISEVSRGMKFRMLNCTLRLKKHLESYGDFGDDDDSFYYEHFRDAMEGQKIVWNDVEKNPQIAARMKSAYIWQHRYNVSPSMINLVKEKTDTPDDNTQDDAIASWGQYVRWLFVPGHVYNFSALGNVFVYIGANQSLPNRDRKYMTEAIGRSLSVAFFNEVEVVADGRILAPTDTDIHNDLSVTNRTVAEISLASGYFPPLPANHTPRDAEVAHEANVLNHDVVMYDAKRDGTLNWNLLISSPRFMEDDFAQKVNVADMKKIALARQIQLREGLSDDARNDLLKYTKAVLLARLA
jgi:hypothetical protein